MEFTPFQQQQQRPDWFPSLCASVFGFCLACLSILLISKTSVYGLSEKKKRHRFIYAGFVGRKTANKNLTIFIYYSIEKWVLWCKFYCQKKEAATAYYWRHNSMYIERVTLLSYELYFIICAVMWVDMCVCVSCNTQIEIDDFEMPPFIFHLYFLNLKMSTITMWHVSKVVLINIISILSSAPSNYCLQCAPYSWV